VRLQRIQIRQFAPGQRRFQFGGQFRLAGALVAFAYLQHLRLRRVGEKTTRPRPLPRSRRSLKFAAQDSIDYLTK
jgi:hypothetical protein